ncbi:recombinase family protein [Paraglaciecola sp.]|uniref:recombinase family protein n=1 Tax=Paraglaciecola sp. TaxID=1920173 RepID=UPI0030F44C7B
MKGQKIGYKRVSSFEQNEQRQLDQEVLDRVFVDKASGKDTNRPQLKELLLFAREGDEVVVHSMDRLARNLDDLRQIVKGLTNRGISIRFVKEGLTFTNDADSPMSNLLLSMMGAFAEFERSLIKERQREGIELAKKKGIYKGRKQALTSLEIISLIERVKAGGNKSQLAKEFGISRQTLYGYIN